MLETNYLEYPASIQEAMGMQVDWTEEEKVTEEIEEEPVPETSVEESGVENQEQETVGDSTEEPSETETK